MFLFGARQTGKSTLLKERFKGAVYYDLLKPNVRRAFKQNPDSLWEALQDKPAGTLVIVDEIQKVPELLDVVHSLMVERGLFFILSGSSSRKLKRSGANTLGGRAIPETLYPLVWPEVTDFQIDRAVQNGMIPRHYMVEDATKRLSGYVKVYLDEEIREEGEVRELDAFERFMEVAAISDGEMLNYSNIATEVGKDINTIKKWVSVLEASGIIYILEPFSNSSLKRVIKTPKLYFRDTGLAAYLSRWLTPDTLALGAMSGAFFETFVISEILKSYSNRGLDYRYFVSYYRGKDKKKIKKDGEEVYEESEIDFIIEQNGVLYPIEIKKNDSVTADMTSAFQILDKIPEKKRGTGAIICMCSMPGSLRENILQIPYWYI